MTAPEETGVINNGKYQERGVFVKASGIPLAMADMGKTYHVAGIRGKDEVKSFLHSLGFVDGAEVTLISSVGGDVIVNIKGTRVAISKTMATKILTA